MKPWRRHRDREALLETNLPPSRSDGGFLCAVRIVCAFAVASLLAGGSAHAQNIAQQVYVTNGSVYAEVVSGNTLYIGGSFTSVGPAGGQGVPLDQVSGAPVGGFPKVAGEVYVVAPDGAGGWFIGGAFSAVGGIPRSNIAHILADNSVSSWNPNPNGQVRTLAVSGGIVYAGGYFSSIGGQPRNWIAALDATLDNNNATPWNPNADGPVYSLAVSGSTVYAGGFFSNIGGQPRNYVAALNALVDNNNATPWNPNPDGPVYSLAVSGSTVYAGGDFATIGGQTRNNIAALDATLDNNNATAWSPNANGAVLALAANAGTVYAGGSFTSIGAWDRRNGIASLDLTTGVISAWNPDAGTGTVYALAVSGSTVYAGGTFTNIGGQPRNNIAALDATAATNNATPWNPSANSVVRALAVSGSTVYAGGFFTMIGGQPRNCIAALDATTPTNNATEWDPNPGPSGQVYALVLSGTTAYVGGNFTTIGGQMRNRIAALDVTLPSNNATNWNPNANQGVRALALSGTTVYVGGLFTMIGGQSRNRIAALDATLTANIATDWDPSATTGTVWALAVSGSIVYAGGSFTFIGGQPRNHIAALNALVATNNAVPGWDPNADGEVYALALSSPTVYAGGAFKSIRYLAQSFLAAINDATIDVPLPKANRETSLLEQSRPNPASTSSVIRYSLPTSENVTLTVFDASGREIKTLLKNATQGPGVYQVTFDTSWLKSGLYFYRLQAGRLTDTKRMLVTR